MSSVTLPGWSMKDFLLTAAVIFANHFLIAHGQGSLVIPEEHVSAFKKLLVAYYEGEDAGIITAFLKENCWRRF